MDVGCKPDTALCGVKVSDSKAFDPFKGDKKTGLSTKTGLFLCAQHGRVLTGASPERRR